MAEHGREHAREHHPMESLKGAIREKGPNKSQVVALLTLLPVGGLLLALSGATLTGTVLGLAVTTPLFVIFSPVIVPAALVIALSVTGFLASGALGLTALTSLSWIVNFLRGERLPEQVEHAKRLVEEAAGHLGQRAREAGGHAPPGRAPEAARS